MAGLLPDCIYKMCANREPIEDAEAVREELAALIQLSNEKLAEMREIQSRIEAIAAEVEQLKKQLDETEGASTDDSA